MIRVIICALIGRAIGRAIGQRIDDRRAAQMAEPPPPQVSPGWPDAFAVHSDGTVDPPR
jgi:hypothetical protein